jgi:hypothetical protein
VVGSGAGAVAPGARAGHGRGLSSPTAKPSAATTYSSSSACFPHPSPWTRPPLELRARRLGCTAAAMESRRRGPSELVTSSSLQTRACS